MLSNKVANSAERRFAPRQIIKWREQNAKWLRGARYRSIYSDRTTKESRAILLQNWLLAFACVIRSKRLFHLGALISSSALDFAMVLTPRPLPESPNNACQTAVVL